VNDGTDLIAGVLGMSAVGTIVFRDLGIFPFILLFVVVATTALFFGYRALKRPTENLMIKNTTTPDQTSEEKQNNE